MLQFFDTLTDDSGNSLLGATLTVTNYPSGTLATIYSTNGTASPIANSSVAADITGQVSFFAPDGAYTMTYAYKSTIYKVRTNVALLDPNGFIAQTDTGGAANTYVVTSGALPANLYVGLKAEVLATHTNTAASTLNFNTTGAQPVRQPGGAALAAGMIQANGLFRVEWDGTQWQLVGAQSQPFYAQTTQEIAAGVVPTSTAFLMGDPQRYGGVGNGIADDTTAFQTACTVMGLAGGPVIINPGLNFRCIGNITVPCATVFSGPICSLQGSGWGQPGVTFDGAAVTTGLTCIGAAAYFYGPTYSQLCVAVKNGATGGMYFQNLNHPTVDRCWIQGAGGAVGRGIYFLTCLLPRMENVLVTGCGSATQGSVEIDGAGGGGTNFRWDHCRISGGTATVGGLLIDRWAIYELIGGSIESVGTCIKIGSKAEAATSCTNGKIDGLDLENPGNGNPYISLGAGMSGGALVNSLQIDNCLGAAGASTPVPYAIQIQNSTQITIYGGNRLTPTGPGTSQYEITGTNVSGVYVKPCRGFQSQTIPWVRFNGAQLLHAGCQLDFVLGPTLAGVPICTTIGLQALYITAATISGATPSVLISSTAGGFYRLLNVNNGGATNMTALTGGEIGMRTGLLAQNGNTTLIFANNSGGFRTKSGANLALVAGKIYWFTNDGANGAAGGSCWVEDAD